MLRPCFDVVFHEAQHLVCLACYLVNMFIPIKIRCNGNGEVFGIFHSVENLGIHSIIEYNW